MKKIITWRVLALLLANLYFICTSIVAIAAVPTSKLIAIKLTASKDKSHVTFTLVGKTAYHLTTLTKPHRVILDLDSAQLATSLPLTPAKTLILRRISQGNPKKKPTLRIILDLTSAVSMKSFVNNSADKTQLLLELTAYNNKAVPADISRHIQTNRQEKPIEATHSKVRDEATHSAKAEYKEKNTEKTSNIPAYTRPSYEEIANKGHKRLKTKGRRNVIVVIDPGHGGKDPGARGPHNSSEKHIVLAISKELQRQLNAYPGIHAVLTRNGDYFLELRQRLRIARKYKAELFIAIHADAAYNNTAHGASVFALSQRGASSEAARWLAERENYSELGQVSLEDKNYQLRSVLLDLSQTATINQSLQVGQTILCGLERVCTLHCRQVEQARFVVLKSPDIPSLLVETGFISNPQEEWRLNHPAYQRQLAQAMAQGIKAFFWRNPPPGSVFYPSA